MSDAKKGLSMGVGLVAGGCGCLFLFCLCIGGCLMIIGTGVDQAIKETVKEQEKAEQESAIMVQQEVNPIVISADELMTAYNDNKISAEMQYKGKVLIVDGTISSLGDDMEMYGKLPHVKLKTSHIIATVHCSFQERDRANLATLQKGQYVTIRGRCDSFGGDIWLKNCIIE